MEIRNKVVPNYMEEESYVLRGAFLKYIRHWDVVFWRKYIRNL